MTHYKLSVVTALAIAGAFSLATIGLTEIKIDIPDPVKPGKPDPPAIVKEDPEPEPKIKPLTLAIDLTSGSHVIGVPSIDSIP